MSETKNYQTAVMHLKTVSPIHVRGKNVSYGEGMVKLNRRDDNLGRDYAFLIDNDILSEWLYELSPDDLRYVNAYCQYFTDTNNREYSLQEFLRQNGLIDTLKSIDRNSRWFRIFKGRAYTGDRNYFIQNKKHEYYIPGSTLKGAIRTAILYHIVKELKANDPQWFCEHVILKVLENIKKFQTVRGHREKNKIKEQFAKAFEQEIFKKCAPFDMDLKNEHGKPDIEQRDMMRCVRITDIPVVRDYLSKEEVMVMTLKNNNEPYEKTKFRGNAKIECYESEDVLRGRISIDLNLLKRFKKAFDNSWLPFSFPFDVTDPVASIEKMLQEFAYDQWAEEIKYYNNIGRLIDSELDDSFKQRPYPCLGYGSVVSNQRGNAYFTNRKNGSFINDMEILHYNKRLVKTNGSSVIYQRSTDSQGRSNAETVFSYRYDRGSQSSESYNSLGMSFVNPIKEFYSGNEKQANIRFGWGTQLLGMTVDLLFDPVLRKLIRDEVLLRSLRNLPAPKSRRFVLKDDKAYKPLGWCKVSFQGDR